MTAPRLPDSRARSALLPVLGLTVLALVVRIAMATRGGLWRDEALFMFVVRLRSWSAMIDFLRFHESHPPLFYFLMRPWLSIVGDNDVAALAIPLVIGAVIVPATYFVGAALFSKRIALIAASLAALSPALVEHSALVRPYSLLPLLTLLSCYALIEAIKRGDLKAWVAYVVLTLALVYTHNWTWLVLGGEWVAVAIVLLVNGERGRGRLVLEWLVAQIAIAIAFLPWLPWLLYQTQHAGHAPLHLDEASDIFLLPFLGVRGLLQATVLGYPVGKEGEIWTAVQRWLLVVPVVFLGVSEFLRIRQSGGEFPSSESEPANKNRGSRRIALVVLLTVPLAAWAAALVLSPRVNLLFPRCLVMLAPPLILSFAYWLERPRSPVAARLAHLAFGFLLVTYVTTQFAISRTTRSNAREFGPAVAAKTRPSDLVIVVPEWLASSFNRYYKPRVEQIDFPYFGREGAVDFAGIRERTADPAALARLRPIMAEARGTGRRIWLMMESRDLHKITAYDISRAPQPDGLKDAGMIRANQIRNELTALYGQPDTSLVVPGPITQFERFRAYLFAVPDSGRSQ